jgi:EAL domain-containing protein (putative c-di-GMP-specific phosphodiesterase class I)
VLEEACRAAASWDSGQTVCVNLSARQFAQPELADEVLAALDSSGLEPARLCLEITESVVMREIDRALATMRRLEELGVRLALDDFGKGHSSLTSLKRFPLDVLKIDRSFVSEIAGDADTEAIVRALVALAHTLEMEVVAEGIESELQLRRLVDLECDLGQGFHLARPLAAERLEAMLADDQPLGALG